MVIGIHAFKFVDNFRNSLVEICVGTIRKIALECLKNIPDTKSWLLFLKSVCLARKYTLKMKYIGLNDVHIMEPAE